MPIRPQAAELDLEPQLDADRVDGGGVLEDQVRCAPAARPRRRRPARPRRSSAELGELGHGRGSAADGVGEAGERGLEGALGRAAGRRAARARRGRGCPAWPAATGGSGRWSMAEKRKASAQSLNVDIFDGDSRDGELERHATIVRTGSDRNGTAERSVGRWSVPGVSASGATDSRPSRAPSVDQRADAVEGLGLEGLAALGDDVDQHVGRDHGGLGHGDRPGVDQQRVDEGHPGHALGEHRRIVAARRPRARGRSVVPSWASTM